MKALRWLILISGILFIILGFFMIGTPASNIMALSIILCIAPLVNGIMAIVSYFAFGKVYRSTLQLVYGILTAILGIWLLLSGGIIAMAAVLPYVFAIWVIASSIMAAVSAFELKGRGVKQWGWSLALGILGVILGFLLMFDPVVSAMTLSVSVALMFIHRGISDIAYFFTTKDMGL